MADTRHVRDVTIGLGLTGVCAAVFVLSYLCLVVPQGVERVAPIWLPNAVTLAVLLMSRRSRWTGFAIVAFAGDVLAHLAAGSSASMAGGLGLCNTLEAYFAAHAVVRVLGRPAELGGPFTLARYAAVTAVAATASAAVAIFLLGAGSGGADAFLLWAAADFAGLLIITPCLLALLTDRDGGRRLFSRDGLTLALLLVVVLFTFLQTRYPLLYLTPPVLLLVTWRLGIAGAAAGVLSTLSIAAVCTIFGRGPIAGIQGPVPEQILSLQLFLAVCFFMSVPVAVQARRARRLKAELVDALSEAQAEARKVRMAQSVARLGYWRLDLASGQTVWSDEMYRMLGMSPGDPLSPELIVPRVHEDDRPAWQARFEQALADGQPYEQEILRMQTLDGDLRYVRARVVLERDPDGRVAAVFGIMLDKTESVRGQLARQDAEARFRLIAEHAHDIIVRADLEGRMLYVSPSCRALGYEPEELVGTSAAQILHPDDLPRFVQNTAELVANGVFDRQRDRQHRFRRKDGEYAWLEGNPTVLRDADGRPAELLNVFRDVTERKALEDELRAARAEAEAAAQVKTEFLANMSHELRTPLTSVVGFTRLAMEQPELRVHTRSYLERVGDASRALLSAVNDILDFSKLEAGQVSLQAEPTPVAAFAKAALELFQPQAGAKDLGLNFDCDLPDDLSVLIDPDRMRQVLLNLIGNAVKFTEAGEVTLRVRYRKSSGRLLVEVRDTGQGIAADKLDRLFKRFSQVDGTLTRTGGTGLGLAICKGIVEAMGGAIGVRSRPGRGSTFHFSVPAPRCEPAAVADERVSDETFAFAGVRVLVADDHPANRELVNLILRGVGGEITEAADGAQAVDLASAWPYDVILMDIRMPILDGLEALNRIRSASGPNDVTPVLAFTADADVATSARLVSAGFQGVVAKPVAPDELIAAMARAIDLAAPDNSSSHAN